ncbi:MAG: hypothetical protein AVDCRST_MAG88-659, partial [uncultured Thermomicrobiales bacterium]
AGLPLAVIEEDLHLVQELSRLGIPAVLGDASHRSILAAAHPERARLIVVALPDSGATRAVVRDARRANPDVPILARLVREGDEAELRRVGATSTIGPERAGAMLLLEESARVPYPVSRWIGRSSRTNTIPATGRVRMRSGLGDRCGRERRQRP